MGWRSDAAKNRELWTQSNRDYTDAHAETNWALDEISWGIWGIDESELGILGDVAGKDVLELGCGAAQWSILLARAGARAVGLDVRARRRGRRSDRDAAPDDRRDEPGGRDAWIHPRRPCARDAEQPRARLRFAGVCGARDRALVHGR